MGWDGVTANAGTGGATFAFDTFTDGGTWTMAYTAIAFGPENGPYTKVTTTDRFPTSAAQSGTWNITNVSGTISLPTGASTSALQTTGNTSLASIDGKITACNTGAVVIASSALPSGAATEATLATRLADATFTGRIGEVQASPTANTVLARLKDINTTLGGTLTVGLPTGAATSALQTTGNTSLATIAGAVSGTEMQVDVITMPTVTISDGGGSITIDGAVSVSGTVTVDTELPAAAALADNAANPTAPAVGAFLMLWDSATWDRAPGTSADGMLVNLGANNDVTVTGTLTSIGSITNPVAVTDNGSTLSVDDGGGSITVDGTVAISGTVTVSGSITADTELTTADLDTGAGTDTRAVVGLVGSASGGGQLIPGSSTDGLLVNLGTNNDVTVTGSVTANAGTNLNTSALALEAGGNLAAAATSLAILDDWDESDRAKVNIIVGQAGVAGGSGVVGATTVRVTLATDVALPTGSNVIGAVTQSGTWNVGTLSTITNVVHIDDNAGSITVDGTVTVNAGSGTFTVAGAASHDAAVSGNPVLLGAYAKATAPTDVSADGDAVRLWADLAGRLQIGDGGQTLSIDDGGGVITVDGTVNVGTVTTVTSITNVVHVDDNGSTLSIDDGGGSITVDGSVSISGTVTVASHAVTNAGTFAVQESGAALTALQLIDDVVYVDDADWTDDTSKHVLVGGLYQSAPQTITDGDVGPFQVTQNGYLIVSVSGTVQAAQSGTWNIATVTTVTTVSTVTAVSDAQVQGKAAHDAAASGNPVLMGGYASSSAPTDVSANGDAVRAWFDLAGRLQIGDGGGNLSVDDGGGSLTVDGTIAATQSGTWNVGTVTTVTTVSTITNVVHVDDNSGSLTVDAPVGTPVFVRLSDGAAAISTLPVSLASVPSHAVTNAGTFAVQESRPGTGTLANVATSTTSATLIASNASRKGAVIFNDSTATLYVKFGATASATSFTYKVAAGQHLELPHPAYTGVIDGILSTGTGTARVTELT